MSEPFNYAAGLRAEQAYVEFKAAESMKPYLYVTNFQAAATCPDGNPKTASCAQFHPRLSTVDDETTLTRSALTHARYTDRPVTVLMGTSAYKAGGEGRFTPDEVDLESVFRTGASSSRNELGVDGARGGCRRTLAEADYNQWQPNMSYSPQVESFQLGGVPTRTNVIQYGVNPTTNFASPVVIPQAMWQ